MSYVINDRVYHEFKVGDRVRFDIDFFNKDLKRTPSTYPCGWRPEYGPFVGIIRERVGLNNYEIEWDHSSKLAHYLPHEVWDVSAHWLVPEDDIQIKVN